ncbi:MAG: AAA family ATPase [Acidobacteriota bacterium]|jgi:dephospho-CoA kinase|nr:AAA family ATPase [Acidobacteriota bacterium]
MTVTATVADKPAPRLHIGLTGRMGSGKGEVVRSLVEKGFHYISLSDMVREEARRLGLKPPIDRSAMQDIGNRMRREGGGGVLGKRVADHIRNHAQIERWVIDGIRNPAEVAALRELPAFFLLGIEAPLDLVLSRLLSRARDTDRLTETELRIRLEREWGQNEPADGQRVGDCMRIADSVIRNDSDLDCLEKRLRQWLDSIEVDHE